MYTSQRRCATFHGEDLPKGNSSTDFLRPTGRVSPHACDGSEWNLTSTIPLPTIVFLVPGRIRIASTRLRTSVRRTGSHPRSSVARVYPRFTAGRRSCAAQILRNRCDRIDRRHSPASVGQAEHHPGRPGSPKRIPALRWAADRIWHPASQHKTSPNLLEQIQVHRRSQVRRHTQRKFSGRHVAR